jgi:hypothetical protein
LGFLQILARNPALYRFPKMRGRFAPSIINEAPRQHIVRPTVLGLFAEEGLQQRYGLGLPASTLHEDCFFDCLLGGLSQRRPSD